MPNGGSDCCGTCWFNRANRGKTGSGNHDRSIPSHCGIRDLAIEDPFYTYCANHPYRRQKRVPTPLGPVYVYTGKGRAVWMHAPDTEEVRSQLLEHLENPANLTDAYPFFGKNLIRVVADECERLREPRAIPILERIAEDLRGRGEASDGVEDAIERIRNAVGGSKTPVT